VADRAVVWALVLTTGLLACGEPGPERGAPRPDGPNVVLIVVDTLRADRLSQFGNPAPTSLALDALASRAHRFDHCFAPAPWTVPSVTSIFSGLLPARHRVDATGAVLGERFETLAESLKRRGWHTAGFSFNPHISKKAGFDQGFHHFRDFGGTARDAPDLREMVDDALAWVRDEARTPFLLYLQPMNVHGPYRVPEDRADALLGRRPRPGFEFRGRLMKEILGGRLEVREEVTEEIRASLEEQYDTAVRYTSDELGRLIEGLEQAGVFDDSLVILTSDHGEELFDRGGFAHGYTLHREVLHVPLLMKLPGQRTGAMIDADVSLVDLYPTVMDLLGIRFEQEIDGRSLRPLLEGGDAEIRPILGQTISPERCDGRTLREGEYELMVIDRNYESDAPGTRLYHIREDPDQRNDLAGAAPDVVQRMRARLEALYRDFGEDAYPRELYELDESTRESLEALGYF
jgi:arylsulfatase A-like enzyme